LEEALLDPEPDPEEEPEAESEPEPESLSSLSELTVDSSLLDSAFL